MDHLWQFNNHPRSGVVGFLRFTIRSQLLMKIYFVTQGYCRCNVRQGGVHGHISVKNTTLRT